MSHKNWLKGLLRRVTKPTPSTQRKRRPFSPVQFDLLEDRSVPATIDWTGGGANANWSTAANWSQNQVPSATNNVLNFGGSVAVTKFVANNDIAGLTGLTINITDSSAAGDFTITGVNTGVTAVNHSKTDNQAGSTTLNLGMTGAGATITDTAGALTILNTDNVFDAASTVNVPSGATITTAVYPSSSLGNAKYNLTGGTLTVAPSGVFFTNAFNVGQNATANNVAANGVPLASLGTDVQPYPMMADISRGGTVAGDTFQTNTRTWGGNKTYFYSGEIFFPNTNGDGTGSLTFASAMDDSAVLYIDGTQYFSFTNNTSAASIDPNTGGNAVTLPTGWHTFDYRVGNGTGGAGVNNNTTNGAVGWVNTANPANPTGKGFGYRVGEPTALPLDAKGYRRLYAGPHMYGINAITQSGNTVTVTTAAVGTNAAMNSSVKVGDKVEISGVTPIQYNGTWTVATVTGNNFTFAHPLTGLGNGTVNPNSTLALPDNGTQRVRYGINTITQSGTVTTVTTAAPGTTTAMPSGVQVGDEVVISGATPAGYNGTWTVTAVTGNNTFTFDHTAAGVGAFTANAANTTLGLPDTGVRVRVPTAANGVVSNAVSVSGNSTITFEPTMVSATLGNLTMASGANLSVVPTSTSNQTVNFGNGSLAGSVTFTPSDLATINFTGVVSETAAAGITKAGAGTLTLSGTNTYTGATAINAGTVNANANSALGTVAVGTTVASGGRLVFGGVTYSAAEPVSINGTGTTTTNGALSSASNATFAGPITLAGNSWITSSANTLTLTGGINAGSNQLTFAGGGTVTVSTTGITSSATIVKTEAGVANLNVANPNLTSVININAGTLGVNVDGALGTVAGATNVASGGTLRFVGPATGSLNYATLEPFNVVGAGAGSVGAINITTGDVAVASPIIMTGSTTLGSGTAGKKLTLNGAITLPKLATVTFTGAGDMEVVQAFGNGTSPSTLPTGTPNSLVQQWYDVANVARDENFISNMGNGDNGGLLARTPIMGSSSLTSPLAFPDITAFNNSTQTPTSGTAANFVDDFAFLWTGLFKATKAGQYQFNVGQGTNGVDDEMSVLIDLNNNGVFENATERFATTIGIGCCGQGSSIAAHAFTLNETHRIAIGFHEFGGGQFGSANFRIVGDAAYDTFTPIDPSDAGQTGMWSGVSIANLSQGVTLNQVVKNGAGAVTLSGDNTYNGTTTINAGILVPTKAASFGTNSAVVVNAGGAIGLPAAGGYTLPASKTLTLLGSGPNNAGTIINLGGNNSVASVINKFTADVSIGSNAGTLTINTPLDVGPAALTVTGAGNTTIAAPITTALQGGAGLNVGQNNTANDLNVANNPTPTFGVDIDLTPTMGNKAGNDAAVGPTTAKGWATNNTWFYRGQMFWPNSNKNGTGTISFAENSDDSALVRVDGVVYISNTAWNVSTTSGPITLPTGWHDVEFRFGNGGGGAGANNSQPGWSATKGFGYRINLDPTGGPRGQDDPSAASINGDDYEVPKDDGTGTLFRTAVSGNALVKSGAGTLNLTTPNTILRNISVTGGILAPETVASLGTPPTIDINGGSLGLPAAGGFTLPASIALSIRGSGANNAGGLLNLGGANTVNSPIKLTGDGSIGANAGTLTVNGSGVNIAGNALTVTGSGNTTIAAPITGVSFVPGLLVGQNNTANDGNFANNPNASFGSDIDLTPTMGNKAGNDAAVGQTAAKGWATNNTWFYRGQMFWPNSNGNGTGTLSFAENSDDSTYMWIDGTQKMNNGAWNVATTSGPVTLPTGWHDVEIRFGNGGGGAGANNSQPGWSASKGFGYRINSGPDGADPLESSTNGADYTIPTDNGTGNLFRNANASGNGLIKTGTGTLTLSGNNTYTRNTTVSGGTVNATVDHAFGVDPTAKLTVSGASSVVNLYDNASAVTTFANVDLSAGTGTVNTGAAGGKLAIKSQLVLPSNHYVTGDVTAQGANLVSERTLTAVSGTVDVTQRLPITMPNAGQLFPGGTTQNNTYNYTAATGSEVLVVSMDTRSNTATHAVGTITYGGVPMQLASSSMATASSYHSNFIYYLALTPAQVGASLPLVVNFNDSDVVTGFAVHAQTFANIDATVAPKAFKTAVTETTALRQSIPLTGIVGGSAAVTTFNYRLGNTGDVTQTTTGGTPVTGGQSIITTGAATATTAASGNLWYRRDADTSFLGGTFLNLPSGDTTITANALGAAGTSHFNGAAAVFQAKAAPVNLPTTSFVLTGGAKLSVNGTGDSVIGGVSAIGDGQVIPGLATPATLTFGGIGGAGVGAVSTTSNLGLKMGANSTFKVDVNGTGATQYDQVNVNGAVNLTGATLQVTSGFTPGVGNSFTIISNDAADAVTGTFTGLAEGSVVVGGTGSYTITYKGGDGNDVVLTATTPGATTTTTLVATPLATTGGSSVQFTATVAPSPAALGTVTFLDNGVAIAGGSNIAVANGIAVFSTTTLAAGTHPVTASYSGAAGFAPSTSNVQTVTITGGTGGAPTVSSVTFNGGLTGFTPAQRSRIINATVAFDQAVLLDTGAMSLALHTGNVNYAGNAGGTGQPVGAGIPGTLTATPSTDQKTWTLTWSGANTQVGSADQLASLLDGVYDLVIDATKVHPVGSPTVNMAANSTTVFHRLFGDTNAAAVNGNAFTAILAGNDNLAFRGAFNKPVGGGYLPYMDFNGDGQINSGDNLAFRTRFNKNLTWTV